MTFEEMYALCKENLVFRSIDKRCSLGRTSCVAISASGKVYTSNDIHLSCGLSYCAEESIAIQMLNNNENVIKELMILEKSLVLIPPCGKCLEILTELSEENRKCIVHLGKNEGKLIEELMPYDWKDIKDSNK